MCIFFLCVFLSCLKIAGAEQPQFSPIGHIEQPRHFRMDRQVSAERGRGSWASPRNIRSSSGHLFRLCKAVAKNKMNENEVESEKLQALASLVGKGHGPTAEG